MPNSYGVINIGINLQYVNRTYYIYTYIVHLSLSHTILTQGLFGVMKIEWNKTTDLWWLISGIFLPIPYVNSKISGEGYRQKE